MRRRRNGRGEARDEPTEKRNPRVSTRIHRKIKIIACERTAKVEEEEQGERRCFQAASVNVKTKEIQSKLVRFPVSVFVFPVHTDAKRVRTRITCKDGFLRNKILQRGKKVEERKKRNAV